MGAVDTTYTFTATDTITSTKMNNIIDQTTITTDAIIGTTLDVASGKLKVRSQGITSNEMGAASVTQTALAPNVAGNGPAFSAYQTTGTAQVLAANSWSNVIALNAELFDTNNNFDTSTYRFTPTIAGYYQVSGVITYVGAALISIGIFKNGVVAKYGSSTQSGTAACTAGIIYLNGTTDYLELRGYSTVTATITSSQEHCFFDGCLIRSA